jgi:hypothetical protein
VFPELSMSAVEFNRISRVIVNQNRFLVAGVGVEATGPYKSGKNEAWWDMMVRVSDNKVTHGRFSQKKHHRWRLTKSQILQYGLTSNLHPGVDWWEHITIGERSLAFASLRPWLTTSVLICEDLARPDPVGDILRASGPNLIIALLSDGPQISGRWPGRYAGALADDPGTSVLTVTSEGMSRLSKPRTDSKDRSGVVALWRDAKTETKELDLPLGAAGLLLNLSAEYHEEWTADGRGDGLTSGYPVLTGTHPIWLPSSK